jgi:hypothetical protein
VHRYRPHVPDAHRSYRSHPRHGRPSAHVVEELCGRGGIARFRPVFLILSSFVAD